MSHAKDAYVGSLQSWNFCSQISTLQCVVHWAGVAISTGQAPPWAMAFFSKVFKRLLHSKHMC